MRLKRNPLFLVGVALLVLGTGNFLTGRSKLKHYRGVLAEQHGSAPLVDHGEFTHLTEAMNASLLRSLRTGGEYLDTQDKLEFYQVVDHGGRLLAVSGLGCMATALLLQRRQGRPLSR